MGEDNAVLLTAMNGLDAEFEPKWQAIAFATISHKLLEYLEEAGLPRADALQRLARHVVEGEPG